MQDETRKKVLRLWQENRSGSQIAAELGVSRNAVLGVVKRHKDKGNALRGPLPWANRIQKPKPVERLFDYATPPSGVTLMGLRHASCRYIVREEETAIYCGRDKTSGPYCADHYALCYRPVKKPSRQP